MRRGFRSRGTRRGKTTTLACGEQSMIFRRAALLCLVLAPGACTAQPDFQRYGRPADPGAADPAIAKALATIDPSRIEQTIQTLVAFGTRNTSTSMETGLPPGEGIEA